MSRKRVKAPAIDDLLVACFDRGQAFFVGDLSGLHVGMLRAFDVCEMPARFVAVQALANADQGDHEVFDDLRDCGAICLAVLRTGAEVSVRHSIGGMQMTRALGGRETILDAWLAMAAPGNGKPDFFPLPAGLGGVQYQDGRIRVGHVGTGRKGSLEFDLPKEADIRETLRHAFGRILG